MRFWQNLVLFITKFEKYHDVIGLYCLQETFQISDMGGRDPILSKQD